MADVLVAGATGVLGSRVLAMLVAAGYQVAGTTRRSERLAAIEQAGGHGLIMDALDPDSVEMAVAAAAPSIVIHELTDLAGRDYAANDRLRRDGTALLVAAAVRHGVRTMVAQSISWDYQEGPGPAAESEPLAQRPDGTPAAPGVQELERLVATMPTGVVLRYGLLYGPDTWYGRDGRAVALARQGEVEAATAWTSFVHVDDAAAATVQAIDWPSGPVNIVDDEPTHVEEWGPLFVRAAGFEGVPSITARSNGRAADNTLARARRWDLAHRSWRTALIDPRALRPRRPRPYGRR